MYVIRSYLRLTLGRDSGPVMQLTDIVKVVAKELYTT